MRNAFLGGLGLLGGGGRINAPAAGFCGAVRPPVGGFSARANALDWPTQVADFEKSQWPDLKKQSARWRPTEHPLLRQAIQTALVA